MERNRKIVLEFTAQTEDLAQTFYEFVLAQVEAWDDLHEDLNFKMHMEPIRQVRPQPH